MADKPEKNEKRYLFKKGDNQKIMPRLWRAEDERRFTVEKGDEGVCVNIFSVCCMPLKCFYHTFHNFLPILHGHIAWSK